MAAGAWESFDSFDALLDSGSGTRAESSRKRRREQPTFNTSLRAMPHQAESIPDIADATEETTEEQHVAEVSFFNQRNTSYWLQETVDRIRPYDFPYVRQLIQAPINETLSPESIRTKGKIHANIQVVTRKYEEQFLFEPSKKERRCAMDSQCQGLKIPTAGNDAFILKEFLLPTEKEELERSGRLPKERRLCLMCKRAEIAKAHINMRAEGMGCRNDVTLQSYRNIVGVEGEYYLRDTIPFSENIYQGLLDPVVLHTRTSYRIAKDENGKRYYDQWKLKPFLLKRPGKAKKPKKVKSVSGQTAQLHGTRRRTRSMTRH